MKSLLEWVLSESSEPFMVLYRVNKGGRVNPRQAKRYARGKNPEIHGIFLSRQPHRVASFHGIRPGRRGNLNAYKIHKAIKKEPGVTFGVFDAAWEIFIPVEIWEKYEESGLIKYLGRSGKHADDVHRDITLERVWKNNIVRKKIEAEIGKIKQFVIDNNLGNKGVFGILGKYFSEKEYNNLIGTVDEIKDLFDKYNVRYNTRLY